MRILVVEDEAKLAQSIKKGLQMEAYSVDVANDGDYGYDLAATENYDLIILDIMLPGMDGLKICQKLRTIGKTTPILMLTARSQLSDRVTGLNEGADDYLVKPFAFAELLARIKALLRRPKTLLPKELKAGDLKINLDTFQAERGGKIINLSKKEFSLLTYLAKNQGRVLSKEQIISSVWDFESDILPNTVEVYIGYLKSKIDKPFPKKPLLKTVRGFGYMLEK